MAFLFTGSPSPESGEAVDARPSDVPRVEPQEAIRRMLTRLPISDGQMAVYKCLFKGRLEYGEFLLCTQTRGEIMAGVLGALGRRINNTAEIHQAGLPGNCNAVLKWEEEGGKRYVCLTPHAFEALKSMGLVRT